MNTINYEDYILYYELKNDSDKVTLWRVVSIDGEDLTSFVDSHDWKYFEDWINSCV